VDYPEAVIEKATRHAELVQRVEAGDTREQVCGELGIQVDEDRLAILQAKYEEGGRIWQALLDGRHGHSQKVHSGIREWLYERKKQNEDLRAPDLAEEIEEKFSVKVSDGHINYLLRKRSLTAAPGRPYKQPAAEERAEPVSESTESLDNAGIFFPGSSEGRDEDNPGG
jgi:transposase